MYCRALQWIPFFCLMSIGSLTATWSSPDNLSSPGQDADGPQIAVDANGNATAVWQRNDGGSFIIQSSTKPLGALLHAADFISASAQMGDRNLRKLGGANV